ncbi:MAG TPA: response regulator transcription factor [Geminicoccaceae bacterium]|nr:response regulator transcription factor [Geminicoccaceae bacterium]
MRILLVEDAEDIADAVSRRLGRLGYAVDTVAAGDEAQELLRTETSTLVLLDLMLPGVGGDVVLRDLRRRRPDLPVLVLTARSTIDDKVSLLDLGADDYLVKPFDFRELEARCRALIRRPHGLPSSTVQLGNLTFDGAARRVLVEGRAVELSSREFRLLELFVGNQGRVLSKEAVIDQLFSLDDPVAPNAVELYVSRLRRKIAGASVAIRTVRGLGYLAETHGPN